MNILFISQRYVDESLFSMVDPPVDISENKLQFSLLVSYT